MGYIIHDPKQLPIESEPTVWQVADGTLRSARRVQGSLDEERLTQILQKAAGEFEVLARGMGDQDAIQGR